MVTRRDLLKYTAAVSTTIPLHVRLLQAQERTLISRIIPSTGEELPIVGLGSSATFSQIANSEDISALSEVMHTLVEMAGPYLIPHPVMGVGCPKE